VLLLFVQCLVHLLLVVLAMLVDMMPLWQLRLLLLLVVQSDLDVLVHWMVARLYLFLRLYLHLLHLHLLLVVAVLVV
jgi:hypothetical protein